MELAAVCKIKRQFNLENLTTNSTLKQSKSIEISKDLILILYIYRVYEKKGRDECLAFLRKKMRAKNLSRAV
jgi:replicative DNA helicase